MRGFRGVRSSAVARLATLPITVLSGLATTAIVISSTGSAGYAALSIATTITQLLPFADLGVGAGVVNALARSREEARAAISSALRITLASAALMVLIAAGGLIFLPLTDIAGVGESNIAHMDWAFSGALVLFAVAMPLSLGQRILIGLMRNSSAILIAAVAPVISLALSAVIALAALPPWLFGLTPTFGLVVANAIALYRAIGSVDYKLSSVVDRSSTASGILSQGAAFTIGTIALSATLPMGRVVLARESTMVDLAEFSLVMQMYLPILSVVSAAAVSLWPHFALRRERKQRSARAIGTTTTVFALAGLGGGAALLIFGQAVGHLVSGGEVNVSGATLAAAAGLLVVQSAQLVVGMALTSPGGLWFQAFFSLPMGAVALILTSILAPVSGAAGPYIAATIAVFTFAFIPGVTRILVTERGES